jgi:TldD protein
MSSIIETIKSQLQNLKTRGAAYADARFFPCEEAENLFYMQGNLKSNSRSITTGIGVRVLVNGAWGFAASSVLDTVSDVFDRAYENACVASQRISFPVQLADRVPVEASYESPCEVDPFTVPLQEKIDFLKRIDEKLNKPPVAQRICGVRTVKRNSIFLDSDGAHIEKIIHDIFVDMRAIGVEKNGMAQHRSFDLRTNGYGTRGWESLQDPANFEEHTERVVDELSQVLEAEQCPQDSRSVILLPGIMFLQTHEVIGHALELDRILGYELSYAGGSFVKLEDFGTLQYGSEKLTVRADATLPNSPGSFGYDDDGIPCRNTVLIDKGILKNAITSRQSVVEANTKAGKKIFDSSGGCNRACNFNRFPIERMTNINIDAGDDGTLENIIAKTENGIVLDGDRSWSIGSNREQFHFACEIGWLVKDGSITGMVKNPTYGSDTLPFWRSLSAVGDESTRDLVFVPNCGKGLPSQAMILGHHIPVCRFDNITIGK